MRVKLILLLVTILVALIFVSMAYAAKVPVSWSSPTQNTDGSPLTDLSSYRIEWGTCNGDFFGVPQASITVPASLTRGAAYPTGLNPVCIRVYAINTAGVSSAPSNAAKATLPGTIQKPITLGQPVTLP